MLSLCGREDRKWETVFRKVKTKSSLQNGHSMFRNNISITG